MVRRRTLIFLGAVLCGLLLVPGINIFSAPSRDAIQWREKSFLYNMDFALRGVARLLYPWGISTDPAQVVIGLDDWLFLGDVHEQTRTVNRRSAAAMDFAFGKQVGAATQAWDAYLSERGVKVFKIMIAPNKDTIYSEYLPSWAQSVSPNTTDALFAGTGSHTYVDVREALWKARTTEPEALYYKTDTHWNDLGAGLAFRAFAQEVGKSAPDLQWPSERAYQVSGVERVDGGDLANFLRLSTRLPDSKPTIHAASLPVETTQFDFDTRQIVRRGGNPSVVLPAMPLLVKSAGALNNKKVLWLRDSFGIGLSPLMAATFSDVLQVHWAGALKPGGRFVQLVEAWKPDYVFFTVVERSASSPLFAVYPSPLVVARGSEFEATRTATVTAIHHLSKGRMGSEFQIIGNDPYVEFSLSTALKPAQASYLSIDLTCEDGSTSVPLQIFWTEGGRPHFDEEHSARLSFRTGQNLIDVRTLPKWGAATGITGIRLDVDAKNSCVHFKLNNPSLGLKHAKS